MMQAGLFVTSFFVVEKIEELGNQMICPKSFIHTANSKPRVKFISSIYKLSVFKFLQLLKKSLLIHFEKERVPTHASRSWGGTGRGGGGRTRRS